MVVERGASLRTAEGYKIVEVDGNYVEAMMEVVGVCVHVLMLNKIEMR